MLDFHLKKESRFQNYLKMDLLIFGEAKIKRLKNILGGQILVKNQEKKRMVGESITVLLMKKLMN